MKKILSLAFLLIECLIVHSQDETYYQDLLELSEMADREASFYINLKTLQILCNNPKIFIDMENAYPNTYAWYLWNDYNSKPNNLAKLTILRQIEELNKE